jgi:hypothetical protein
VIPQGKNERDGNLAGTERHPYNDTIHHMEPQDEPYGGYTVGRNGSQTLTYHQTSYENPATYGRQPSFGQQATYEQQPHRGDDANGGAKTTNYSLKTVGEGFPRLDGRAVGQSHPPPPKAESVFTEPDSVLLRTGDEEGGFAAPVRPSGNNRTESHNTISNLHIPGGYPKNTQA